MILIVMNHAPAASGVLYCASISPVSGFKTLGAKIAMTNGNVLTNSAAKLLKSIRTLVRIVISSVSRVRDEFSAP